MYIEIDESFPTHRKTLRFCGLLNDHNAFSYLIRLWTWAARSAADGNISELSVADIEIAVQYRAADGRCYAAMVRAGFVDERDGLPETIHNWMDRTGASIKKMEASAAASRERKRRWRDNHKADGDATERVPERRSNSDGDEPEPGKNAHSQDQARPGQSRPGQARSDQDQLQQGERGSLRAAPRLAVPGKIWGSAEWLRRFGFAWADQYEEHAYAHGTDGAAEKRLDGMLNDLPTEDLLAAQENAPRMFAEFLAFGDERTVDRRHPFSFFVQVWPALRVEKRNTDWPISFIERKRKSAKAEAARQSEAACAATDEKLAELRSTPVMSPAEIATMQQEIRSLAEGKAALG